MKTRYRNHAFTMTEITIVLAIVMIIIAIAIPTWLRQRENSRGIKCQENLAKISDAKEQYAMEFKISNGGIVDYPVALMTPNGSSVGYLKSEPFCAAGGTYTANAVGTDPTCSIGTSTAPYEPHVIMGR